MAAEMASGANVAALRRVLEGARRVVIFTGAGISTESGIPDFRGPGGWWTQNRPIDFADFLTSEDMRREAWHRRFALEPMLAAARPNHGHRAIAEIFRRGIVQAVITQNIDGLHQDSGIPAKSVIELHGNTTYAKCLSCGRRYEIPEVRDIFRQSGEGPVCLDCGGFVKTATISFGQPMPEPEMEQARAATLSCDLFLALGSSLVVYPAAGFPILAKENDARLVIINREPTPLDGIADMVIHGELGSLLGGIAGIP